MFTRFAALVVVVLMPLVCGCEPDPLPAHAGNPPGPWRNDPLIGSHVHPDHPSDVQVLFLGVPGADRLPGEILWVRVTASEPGGWYSGTLLNQPVELKRVEQGDEVRMRMQPGWESPVYVGDREAANLERYACHCESCGLDMNPDNLAGMVGDVLRDPAASSAVTAFSTRCPGCGETMIVKPRQ